VFNRITLEPPIPAGRSCFRGTRITAAVLVKPITHGVIREEVLAEHADVALDGQAALDRCA
jgi:uncharacterized protein (DUF433 family)